VCKTCGEKEFVNRKIANGQILQENQRSDGQSSQQFRDIMKPKIKEEEDVIIKEL
jgi:hypothetical protein